MSLRKLGKETVIYGLSNILGRLLNYVVINYILTRLMDPREFGEVGELLYWTAVLIALIVFRMDTAVFRFASRAEYDREGVLRRTQRFVTVAALAVCGGICLFAVPIAAALDYGSPVYVYLVMGIVGLDALSAVPLARLRLDERAWAFAAVNIANVAVNLGLVALLLYGYPAWLPERYDPSWNVGYYLVAFLLASLLRYLALVIDGYRHRKTADGAEIAWSTLFHYSYPLTVVAVAGIFNALSGPMLLRQLGGEAGEFQAGLFNAAVKIAVILNLFVTAYNYAAEPFFFRQASGDLAAGDRTIYADAARAYVLIAVLASAFIMLFLPWLSLIIDAEERQGLEIMPLLLGGNLLFGLYANFSIAYKLTDRTLLGGGVALLGSLVIIVINYLFMREYGIWAPAVGMFACYALMCALGYRISRRYFPAPYALGRMLLYVAIALPLTYFGLLYLHFWHRLLVMVLLTLSLLLLDRKWLLRLSR